MVCCFELGWSLLHTTATSSPTPAVPACRVRMVSGACGLLRSRLIERVQHDAIGDGLFEHGRRGDRHCSAERGVV